MQTDMPPSPPSQSPSPADAATSARHAFDDNRAVIRVAGDGATAFLNQILTANLETIANGTCRAGALLTPQGRILADMMIGIHDDAIHLECDAARADDLFARLRRYRLRLPIDIEIMEGVGVWIGWGGGGMPPDARADARRPELGWRWVAPKEATPPGANAETISPVAHWHTLRIASGVPQGPLDLVPERALLLEAGLDHLGAVDFEKGCYVGQEVTARTHYRGLVKRRIAPLSIRSGTPAPGADVGQGETRLGNVLSAAGGPDGSMCLAAMKLSDLHRLLENDDGLVADGMEAHLALPDWMMPLPQPARTDKA